MKRIYFVNIIMTICIMLVLLFVGCGLPLDSNVKDNNSSEVPMKNYYNKQDFKTIIIGKSKFEDVCVIAPTESMQVTSYGGFCDYPTQDGGYIRVKFYGKELIVGEIAQLQSGKTGDGSLS